MRIVVLTGERSGARFLATLTAFAPHTITAIVNTGGDITLHGLRICPDLDTTMYTVAGAKLATSFVVRDEMRKYDVDPTWYPLSDPAIATHLLRTHLLNVGFRLSAVTTTLTARWRLPARLLPMTDDHVATHVIAEERGDRRAFHVTEWRHKRRRQPPPSAVVTVGTDRSEPAPDVLAELGRADLVLIAPANPATSIEPILTVPGIREAVAGAPGPVVGVSPFAGEHLLEPPVRHAETFEVAACCTALGIPASAAGIARHYGSRGRDGLLDGWIVDPTDADVPMPGFEVVSAPLTMADAAAKATLARAALGLAI